MFNVGGGEMFAILLLALLVLGPERLPKAMGQVGHYVGQLRRISNGFQDEIRRAMDIDDAPFRPGEETARPAPSDEVRVVNAIDTTVEEGDTAPAEEGTTPDGDASDERPEAEPPHAATGTDGPLP